MDCASIKLMPCQIFYLLIHLKYSDAWNKAACSSQQSCFKHGQRVLGTHGLRRPGQHPPGLEADWSEALHQAALALQCLSGEGAGALLVPGNIHGKP